MKPTAALVVAAIAATSAVAYAHQVGLSRGEYALADGTLRIEITFARGELISIARAIDVDGDGKLSPAELEGGKALVEGAVVRRIDAAVGGAACRGSLVRTHLTEEDGAAVLMTFACPKGGAARVELPLLEDLAHGHRHIARAKTIGGGDVEEVLFRTRASFEVPEGPPLELGTTGVSGAEPPRGEPVEPPGGSTGGGALRDRGVWIETIGCALALALSGVGVRGRAAVVIAFALGLCAGRGLVVAAILAPTAELVAIVVAATLVAAGVGLAAAPRGGTGAAAASMGMAHGLGLLAGPLGLLPAAALGVAAVGVALAEARRPVSAAALRVAGWGLALGGLVDVGLRIARRWG